jgi:hypothetical protein
MSTTQVNLRAIELLAMVTKVHTIKARLGIPSPILASPKQKKYQTLKYS